MVSQDIYTFITTEEAKMNDSVDVVDGWRWSLREHVTTSILYKNGRLKTGNHDDKPVKNIVLPILNLEYRAEDIDVKDIQLYVDDPDDNYLSFFIKKYHDDVFVIENDVDTFIDEEKEEHIDLGGVLVKDVGKALPDIVRMQDIAFCNQNNIIKNPIGIKHLFSPDQLKDMEDRGWGKSENGATATIDEVIALVQADMGDILGNDIKVYEVHGVLPKSYLDDYSVEASTKYVRQFQVVTFYKDSKGDRKGVKLFAKEEPKNIFKLFKRDNIYNRALGRGGVEELFEDQVWTTYGRIHKKNLLDAASKMISWTNDETLAARHPSGLKNLNNLEVIQIADGKQMGQVDTYPRNIALFDKWDMELEQHARGTGGAQEAIMGDQPPANTPFKSVELQSAESHSLHNYRIGKHAKFIEEMYYDWFIPYMSKEIKKGAKFLSELSMEEMQMVADKIATKRINDKQKEIILSGQVVDSADMEVQKAKLIEEWKKDGNKKFITILKDEIKDLPIKVKVNVSEKQKRMGMYVEKLTNVFRQVIAAPQVLQDKNIANLFNQILEYSGLDKMDFSAQPQPVQMPNQQQQPQPVMQPVMAQ